jgi:hypothetical protein
MAEINTVFFIKQGDLLPDIVMTALDGDDPVSLTTALSARFIMRKGTEVIVDSPVSILNQMTNLGQVSYSWEAGDTDIVGTYKAELEIMWPLNKPQTFPAKGYMTVVIGDDLS